MLWLVTQLLPWIFSLNLAVAATLKWKAELRSPSLYGIVSFLACLGLHRVLELANAIRRLLSGDDERDAPGADATVFHWLDRVVSVEVIVTCLILIALGLPMLIGLKRAMARR